MEYPVDASKKSFLNKFIVRVVSKFSRRLKKYQDNPFELIRVIATFVGVAGCVLVVWLAMNPSLVFTNTTATGGDMGAHVWWPAFMRDHLLPHGRIFGWSMDSYSGFPVGQYYFPAPALMVVALNLILPYNIAFKLITVIGGVALPLAAYILGKSIKAPKPIPMLMAFGATAFLFFTGDPRGTTTASTLADYKNANFNQHIMGGPLLSEMAGEFSFSIALTFALLFLAAFFVMLREGKYKSRVAILFALTVMSHLVVGIFLGIAVLVFWGASYASRQGLLRWLGYSMLLWVCSFSLAIGVIGAYFFDKEIRGSFFEFGALAICVLSTIAIIVLLVFGWMRHRHKLYKVLGDAAPLLVGVLLSGIWLFPLLSRFAYTSNMRYEKLVDLPSTPGVNEVYELYIAPSYFMWPVFIPAAIGFILSATLLRKSVVPLLLTAATMAVVFVNWPEGAAWNLRFLPFWYLFVFFMAAVGYGELFRIPSSIMSRISYSKKSRSLLVGTRAINAGVTSLLVVVFFIGLVGFGSAPKDPNTGCASGVDTRVLPDRRGYAHSWAQYNFEGYERKPQLQCGQSSKGKKTYTSSTEFKDVIDTMNKLPQGRTLWEQSEGSYGTTLALALLPYFTDHKIGSQEGLYFEAAGSTAYHFLTVAEVSKSASNAMRWPSCPKNLDGTKKDPECFDSYYGTIADFDRGIDHMKMMGITYYMVHSDEVKKLASDSPRLELLDKIPDRDGLDPFGWDVYKIKGTNLVEPLAVDPVVVSDKSNPRDWAQSGNKWLYDWFNAVGQYPEFVNDGPKEWDRKTAKQALATKLSTSQMEKSSDVKVSKVSISQDSISFHVDKIGEPVLVKVSYYPTFKADGAGKVYRASPNSMVVIPTKNDVKISIQRDSVEWISILLFIIGIIACVVLKLMEKRTFKQLSGLLKSKH